MKDPGFPTGAGVNPEGALALYCYYQPHCVAKRGRLCFHMHLSVRGWGRCLVRGGGDWSGGGVGQVPGQKGISHFSEEVSHFSERWVGGPWLGWCLLGGGGGGGSPIFQKMGDPQPPNTGIWSMHGRYASYAFLLGIRFCRKLYENVKKGGANGAPPCDPKCSRFHTVFLHIWQIVY